MNFKVFFSRVKDMSLKRMWLMVCLINKEFKTPKIFIVVDMIWCALRYSIGYLEYKVFGFAKIHGKKRKTFMTMKDNIYITAQANKKELSYLFDDKLAFDNKFKNYIGRDFLDLRTASLEDFENFCKGKKIIFVKQLDGFGGIGAGKIDLSKQTDLPSIYNSLLENQQVVVEDCVVQNSILNNLCPCSINTVRIVTILTNGEVHVMYSLVRMGDGTKPVDNISSGGMYAPVDENGIIFKPAFCDKTGEYYDIHPFTKTKIVGFEIPLYKDAIEFVKKAALEVPEIGYVGWDVAISENDPVLIEGNTLPGYDMCQNYYHLINEHTGILPKFKKVLGNDLTVNKK